MPWLLLSTLPLAACASVLELRGADSSVQMNGAKLVATCGGDGSAPTVSTFIGLEHEIYSGSALSVRSELTGVPTTCGGLDISTPCASDNDYSKRPFFFCKLDGSGSSVVTAGQIASSIAHKRPSGEVLGSTTFVECPFEQSLVEFAPGTVTISVYYYVPTMLEPPPTSVTLTTNGQLLSFQGRGGGNVVTLLASTKAPSGAPTSNSPTTTDGLGGVTLGTTNYNVLVPTNGEKQTSGIRYDTAVDYGGYIGLKWPIFQLAGGGWWNVWGAQSANGADSCAVLCSAMGWSYRSHITGDGYPSSSTTYTSTINCKYINGGRASGTWQETGCGGSRQAECQCNY